MVLCGLPLINVKGKEESRNAINAVMYVSLKTHAKGHLLLLWSVHCMQPNAGAQQPLSVLLCSCLHGILRQLNNM